MSRSGNSGVFGKLTEEIKIRLSYATAEALRRQAAELGITYSELARIRLDCAVHGIDQVANMAADQIRRAASSGE